MADDMYDSDGNIALFPRGPNAFQGTDLGDMQNIRDHGAGGNGQAADDDEELRRNLNPQLREGFGSSILDGLHPNVNVAFPAHTFKKFSTDFDDNIFPNNEESVESQANNQQARPALQTNHEYIGPSLDQMRNPSHPDTANRVGVEQQERAAQLPQSAYHPQSSASEASTSSGTTSSQTYSFSNSMSSFLSMQSEPQLEKIEGMDCWVFSDSVLVRGRSKIKKEYHCAMPDCKGGREDKSLSSLKKHWRDVHAIKLLPCDFPGCKAAFTCEAHLVRHKVIHTGVRAYECNLCRRAFNRPDLLDRHRALVHGL